VIADPTNAVHPYTILLQLEGVVSFFEYSLPNSVKYKDVEIPHLDLMATNLAWGPHDKDFAALEESHVDFTGHLISAVHEVMTCGCAHFAWQVIIGTERIESRGCIEYL
jgi:hypothetical protein